MTNNTRDAVCLTTPFSATEMRGVPSQVSNLARAKMAAKKDFTDIDLGKALTRFYEQAGYPDVAKQTQLLRPQPEIATIYFVGPIDGPIKIGWASRLEFRLRDLRLANALPLEVWATVEGPPSLERDYHRQFAAHRLHGEWFTRCPEIEAEIARLNDGGGL